MVKRNILITGGTGAMGCELVAKLAGLGHSVHVLTLPGDPLAAMLDGTGAVIHYGDVSKPESLTGICNNIDLVFHLAAVIISNDESAFDKVNAAGTANMLREAKKADVKHFVHVSSASVTYRRTTSYSLSKRIAERIVRESGVPWTIIRPTLVYGREGGLEFDMFLSYLRSFPVIPFIGKGDSLKRPVFVEDIIDGFVKLASVSEGTGRIYNFSGAEAISMMDFARLCLLLLKREDKKIVCLPVWLCVLAAGILKRVMKNPPLKWNVIAGVVQDANLDPSGAIKDLDYRPSSVVKRLPECFPRRK
ncbi:MAG: NAD(P)-dependent oxidoreductase [Fibrobacter sp.]|nr:NAD(P)-dependent oxidoreductase [Fibrobacter sp.]